MKIELERQGSVTVLVPRDSLTEGTVNDLRMLLEEEAEKTGARLVLDMTHIPFVDSVGIEYLLNAAGDSSVGALRPRLASLSDTVREALYLTGCLKRFSLFDSVEAAVRSYM